MLVVCLVCEEPNRIQNSGIFFQVSDVSWIEVLSQNKFEKKEYKATEIIRHGFKVLDQPETETVSDDILTELIKITECEIKDIKKYHRAMLDKVYYKTTPSENPITGKRSNSTVECIYQMASHIAEVAYFLKCTCTNGSVFHLAIVRILPKQPTEINKLARFSDSEDPYVSRFVHQVSKLDIVFPLRAIPITDLRGVVCKIERDEYDIVTAFPNNVEKE